MFRITGDALVDLLNIADAMRLVDRRPVPLEEALREALLVTAATLQATVLDRFDALIVRMQQHQQQQQQPPREPPEMAAA